MAFLYYLSFFRHVTAQHMRHNRGAIFLYMLYNVSQKLRQLRQAVHKHGLILITLSKQHQHASFVDDVLRYACTSVNKTLLQFAGVVDVNVPASVPKFGNTPGLGPDCFAATDLIDKIRCFLLKKLDCLTSAVRRCIALLEHMQTCCQQFSKIYVIFPIAPQACRYTTL